MPRRCPGAGVLYIENDFHGSGVNRIDSCLFPQRKNQKNGGYSGTHASITLTFFTLVKCLKKPERTQGVNPATWGSPTNAQGSWTGSTVSSLLSAGKVYVDRHCPLLYRTGAFYFIS